MDEKEIKHTISVLEIIRDSLKENNSSRLFELSNQKIHSAVCVQDIESITLTIVVYALGKIIERKNQLKIKNWEFFIKRVDSILSLTIDALKKSNQEAYRGNILKIKSTLESISPSLKQYTREIIRNACINKASHIYKHGISLEQTAKLLGITQWELAEYTGQTKIADVNYNRTFDEKSRIKMALNFFDK